MADKPGFYWDVKECAWVRSPKPAETVEVPAQPTASDMTGIAADQEADVRSG